MIEAVLWDLGGVILRTEDRGPRAAWERRLGLPAGELDRLVFAERVGIQAALGQAEPEQVWAWVGARLGLAAAELSRLQHEFWEGDRVDASLIQFIRGLRPLRRTALLSNAWPGTRRLLNDKWKIADAFDELFLSAELGLAKPDANIYRLALQRLRLRPAQTVFVDDFLENVQAAAELGIRAIHFRSAAQARRAVNQLLDPTD